MSTFWAVLRNDFKRTWPRIVTVAVYTAMTLLTMLFSVYVTGTQQLKARVAFYPGTATVAAPQSSTALQVTVVAELPPRSSLVMRQFDAVVTATPDGQYRIDTLYTGEYRDMLATLLRDPHAALPQTGDERGVGVNLIGFMMMFLLMGSFANLFPFADDREKGQLRRITVSPASFGWYLAAHAVYCLAMFLPEYLLLVVLRLLGRDIGFTLLQYAGLMGALALLGLSFALLLNTVIAKPDNATMLGNSITVLTSILAGGFYSFGRNNALLDTLIRVLPQKDLLDFSLNLQNGVAWQHPGGLCYALAVSLGMLVAAYLLLRKQYVQRR